MTQDEIIRMAREAGFADDKGVVHPAYQLEAFANLVAKHEREACAKMCESRATPGTGSVAILNGAADAIRARGNT